MKHACYPASRKHRSPREELFLQACRDGALSPLWRVVGAAQGNVANDRREAWIRAGLIELEPLPRYAVANEKLTALPRYRRWRLTAFGLAERDRLEAEAADLHDPIWHTSTTDDDTEGLP